MEQKTKLCMRMRVRITPMDPFYYGKNIKYLYKLYMKKIPENKLKLNTSIETFGRNNLQ